MASNQEKFDYLVDKLFKMHFWQAGTKEERDAQNGFVSRVADAVAAKVLDWEVAVGDGQKTSLRTIIRWQASDFADLRARIDALSTQLGTGTEKGVSLTKDEQKSIYEQAVKDSLGTYEVRRVEPKTTEGK